MSELAIDVITEPRIDGKGSRRGAALLSAVIVMVTMLAMVFVTGTMSAFESRQSRDSIEDLQAHYLADAGVERGLNFLSQAARATDFRNPLAGLAQVFQGSNSVTPFVGVPVTAGGRRTGSFTVRLTSIAQTASSITIAIDATGYMPDAPSNLPPGARVTSWRALRRTVRYDLAPSDVFNYAYFLNNWGWLYGDSIICNGNARSNGQMDVAGYSPTVTGQPVYDSVSWNGTTATLSGYHDDNGDGLNNGADGGIFSGWNIVSAQNVRGVGGQASNQHAYQDQVTMPNLSDLSRYEANAIQEGGSISIDGVVVSDAVYGDGAGEKDNLYLVGTAASPITINGPVVVRGNVVISGVVTGQGAIYSGGNVYCPNSVTYKNPPTTTRPADNTQASTEAWLSANWNKDSLGLFARENVVVGDFTDSTWQYYVGGWMGSGMNVSREDAGADGMPSTRAGRDGVMGTADDDVLDNDGIWTVERYTAQDAALGLIPAGKNVGDVIPGTGEDIDGDGVYDPQINLSNVVLSGALTSSSWGGNLPSGGVSNYHDISTLYANRLDAVFYTNHTFCWVVLGSEDAQINGSVVSRNEDMIYGTPNIRINYDCRLLGGSSGVAGRFLPTVLRPPTILTWERLDGDSNRHVSP